MVIFGVQNSPDLAPGESVPWRAILFITQMKDEWSMTFDRLGAPC